MAYVHNFYIIVIGGVFIIELLKIDINNKKHFTDMYINYLNELNLFRKTIDLNLNHLEDYFYNDNLDAYFLIRYNIEIGFLLIEKNIEVESIPIDYYISDLYIIENFRRKNLATDFLSIYFNRNRGSYLVGQLLNNKAAILFWKNLYFMKNIKFIEFYSKVVEDNGVFQFFNI